jgi:hypothetical protein
MIAGPPGIIVPGSSPLSGNKENVVKNLEKVKEFSEFT